MILPPCECGNPRTTSKRTGCDDCHAIDNRMLSNVGYAKRQPALEADTHQYLASPANWPTAFYPLRIMARLRWLAKLERQERAS